MDCRLPPPVSEDEISQVLDGVASPSVLSHLERCPACAARMEQARGLERALAATLYRFDCPSMQLLGAYALEVSDDKEAEAIRQHLDLCTHCASELEQIQSLLNIEPSPQLPRVPETPDAPEMPRRGLSAWLPRLFEEIKLTPLPRQPALATRFRPAGVPKPLPEPIIAQADDMTITLIVKPLDDGQVSLSVQVAEVQDERQEEWKGALVTLRRAKDVLAVETLADGVECTFPALPPGTAEVRITSEQGRSVVVSEVELA